MKTYSPEHIQACATFIEENCYDPEVLYGEHEYSDSEIYKVILGQYCIELSNEDDALYGRLKDTDLVDVSVYMDNWYNKYSTTSNAPAPLVDSERKYITLQQYVNDNAFKYNLDLSIDAHNTKRSAHITVTQIENVSEYNGKKRGFNINSIPNGAFVYKEYDNQWQRQYSPLSIVRVCTELMNDSLVNSLYAENSEIFNIYLPRIYNDQGLTAPRLKNGKPMFIPEHEDVKVNAFILYSKLNSMEFDLSKKHLIELAIDMQMTFEQTLEMYKHHSTPLSPCDYPEI